MNNIKIESEPPLDVVTRLLDEASLPSSDIDDRSLEHYLAAYLDGELMGIVGLEFYGADGLLRSLVIRDSARRRGLGRALVDAAEKHAAAMGIETLYLLTTTAPRYFQRLDYRDCPRANAPDSVRSSREFSNLCPDDAVFMCKPLRISTKETHKTML